MNIALIVAAGLGTRLGNSIPKQFLIVKNKPLFMYSVETFNRCKEIDQIYIVTNYEYTQKVINWCKENKISKLAKVVIGGNTRQESVFNGLKAMNANDEDIILIHDSARPLVTEEIILNNIKGCKEYDAVDTAIECTDTILMSGNGQEIDNIPPRKELYQSQTPQTFKFKLIFDAHQNAINLQATDDCNLVKDLNKNIHLVTGNKLNFKITTQEDLKLLESILK